MEEWKPIETAKKDGTRILVFDSENIEIAFWSRSIWVAKEQKDGTYGAWCVVDARSDSYCVNPTHWMELPKPPKN